MRCRNSGRDVYARWPLLIRVTKSVLGTAAFLGVRWLRRSSWKFRCARSQAARNSAICWDSRATTLRRRLEPRSGISSAPKSSFSKAPRRARPTPERRLRARNLRHQYSLNDTARECTLEGDQLAIKIGVAGKVLLGPAGSPGSFNVPVRMAVLSERNNEPITSKLYHAAVTVAAGETEADFTIVSEPLRVPFIQDHAEDDYTIKVGIDEGTAAGQARRQTCAKP